MSDEEQPDGGERRSHRFAARIKVAFRSVEELVTAYTTDLSRGGIFVSAAQQLPIGASVQLSLELPDGGPPERIPARVSYVVDAATAAREGRPSGMGMQFVEAEATPLAERIARFLAAEAAPSDEVDQASVHVLVVEDSTSYRAAIASALEVAGHRVSTAEHGLDALGKAMKDRPDLVLTDVAMPVMDGWQLLRILRARDTTAEVPVVFLTTLDSERDRIRGYQLGVDDYIAKPFTPEELLARVRRVILRHRRDDDAARSGMHGSLEQVSLPSLLAFAEAERRSGLLTLEGPDGDARVGLVDGAIVSVELPDVTAETPLFERVMVLLDIREGRFSLGPVEVVGGPDSVSVQGALLEHARRMDEAAR